MSKRHITWKRMTHRFQHHGGSRTLTIPRSFTRTWMERRSWSDDAWNVHQLIFFNNIYKLKITKLLWQNLKITTKSVEKDQNTLANSLCFFKLQGQLCYFIVLFLKRKRWRSLFMHVFVFSSKGMIVTLLFDFLKRQKSPSPKAFFFCCCFWWHNIHCTVKKSMFRLFCHSSILQWQIYPMKKTFLP